MTDTKQDISPFEFRKVLMDKACSHSDQVMLNAGRGNPNFLATMPRHAFLRVGDFAVQESERSYAYLDSGFGGMPEKEGITARFDTFAMMHKDKPGVQFICKALTYAKDHLGVKKDDLLHEMTMAFLGCTYPSPPRMLPLCETMVKLYLSAELCGTTTRSENFDVFATEGATASMVYLFQSLRCNGLIHPGDKIAIITPIFSPYLEIPLLPEYDLEIVDIKASESELWQVPDSELDKLLDPKIKLLFMVNPSNPPSVKMNTHFLASLKKLVDEKRPDLMIASDDVYATFSDDFQSVFSACPYNTLGVYSFSKYFGVTGWRLGAMALHEDNVFDKALKTIAKADKERLDCRYSTLTKNPAGLKFIDRLVADSRSVALTHTAGLSLPQQLQMMLLSLMNLLDENQSYKAEAKRLIRRRYDILYQAMGVTSDMNADSVDYYTVIDLLELAKQCYDVPFSQWLTSKISPSDFLLRLADETGVVLLPGKGFDIDVPSARVSLANLTEVEYRSIGLAIQKILKEFHTDYKK
jgi:aspartate 4-decarboxylase